MTDPAGEPAFLEIVLRLERRLVPLAEDLMVAQGAQAVTLKDHGDTPLWEPGVGETPLWDEVRLTGLFDPALDRQRVLAALSLLPLAAPPEASELAGRPWERAWMDRFVPMRFGERLWIVPSDAKPPDPEGTLLYLDPGVAFGTGTHATTRLCLEWLDAAPPSGLDVLDFGCGSGVLGIAAALLGAATVRCIDHDPQAVWATERNAERNGVADRVHAVEGDQPAGPPADLVIANILAGILIRLADPLGATVRPGGTLLLTGILADQAEAVLAAFSGARLRPKVVGRLEDWVLISAARES